MVNKKDHSWMEFAGFIGYTNNGRDTDWTIYVTGNLLDSPAVALVNTVNLAGVMGQRNRPAIQKGISP